MKRLRHLCSGLLGAVFVLLVVQAQALSLTDVAFEIEPGVAETATAAYRGSGGVRRADINALTGLFAGDDWSLLDTTRRSSRPFNDVTFTLSADTGVQSGTWGLGWIGLDLPLLMDLVIVMKAGIEWGAYLFESVDVSAVPSAGEGEFEIPWLDRRGRTSNLRKSPVFGRPAVLPDTAPIPGPGSFALLVLALGIRCDETSSKCTGKAS